MREFPLKAKEKLLPSPKKALTESSHPNVQSTGNAPRSPTQERASAPHVGLPRKGHAKLDKDVIGLEIEGGEEL